MKPKLIPSSSLQELGFSRWPQPTFSSPLLSCKVLIADCLIDEFVIVCYISCSSASHCSSHQTPFSFWAAITNVFLFWVLVYENRSFQTTPTIFFIHPSIMFYLISVACILFVLSHDTSPDLPFFLSTHLSCSVINHMTPVQPRLSFCMLSHQ